MITLEAIIASRMLCRFTFVSISLALDYLVNKQWNQTGKAGSLLPAANVANQFFFIPLADGARGVTRPTQMVDLLDSLTLAPKSLA